MKALSLWQPWASFMDLGCKAVETRSWPTSYRGEVLICSAKRWTDDEAVDAEELLRDLNQGINYKQMNLIGSTILVDDKSSFFPLGYALCVVDLVDCVPTDSLAHQVNGIERLLGNFSPGRFGFVTRNLRRLAKPMPLRGMQGLFEVDSQMVHGWLP